MILAILQARVSSTRLPGKVLKPILGQPMLARQVERIRRARRIEKLIVATSNEPGDDPLAMLCAQIGATCFRGSLDDVLDRFYQAARPYCPEHVLRLTGDCPLADPEVIDAVIDLHLTGDYEYTSNCHPPTLPDGLDVEVVRFSVLEAVWREACLPSEREHVTSSIWNCPERFRLGNYVNPQGDFSALRWTVDEDADFELVSRIYEALYPANPTFSMADILALIRRQPELAILNTHHARNEGFAKSMENDRKPSPGRTKTLG